MSDRPVFLIGFMTTGKSTVGPLLASRLGWSFVDLDPLIAEGAGRSIADIFATEGEAAFRRRETDAVKQAVTFTRTIVATGGGAACHGPNLSLMLAAGTVVWLQVTADEVARRLGLSKHRPLLPAAGAGDPQETAERARQLLALREPFYARASLRVDTTALSPDDVASRVAALLEGQGHD